MIVVVSHFAGCSWCLFDVFMIGFITRCCFVEWFDLGVCCGFKWAG